MNIRVAVIATALWAIQSTVQAAPDVSKLPPASTQPGITFAKDIQPIFQQSCLRCHGAEKQKGGLRFDTLEAALKGGEDGPVIVPGKSADSQLVIAVARIDNDSAMPPSRDGSVPKGALTPDQVSLIRGWIDQGAK